VLVLSLHFPVMSSPEDEVYHSAEDEGMEGKEEGVGNLARNVKEIQVSGSATNSADVVDGGEESSSDGASTDNDERTYSHDTAREDTTGETRSRESEATGGSSQAPGPVSDEHPVEERPVKLTEEEAKVSLAIDTSIYGLAGNR